MKVLALVTLLAVVLLADAQTEQVCHDQSDCGEWECCVADADRRTANHKRFIFSHTSGFCRPKRYQGLTCHVFLQQFNGIYNDYCPCDEGLVCEGTTILPNGHHTNPKCIPTNEAHSTPAP
ncbi:venom protein 164-like [Pecten maximus]|uniref:venom protein 164-like n=1 Tax=Pecten maximus TaxID=6579 RepID=UPI001457E8C4|nr:venom protein 164-like [Pecten maximus]